MVVAFQRAFLKALTCLFISTGMVACATSGEPTLMNERPGLPVTINSVTDSTQSTLFVLNTPYNGASTVTAYKLPYNSHEIPITIDLPSSGFPVALAANNSGEVFIAFDGGSFEPDSVYVYASPYKKPEAVIRRGLSSPNGVAVDIQGHLFVGNASSGPGAIEVYQAPFKNARPIAMLSNSGPMAVDASGNLFVVSGVNPNMVVVSEYKNPYKEPTLTFKTAFKGPIDLIAVGPKDKVFISSSNHPIEVYSAPYTEKPVLISKQVDGPYDLAVAPNGDLFVVNSNGNVQFIREYSPPYTDEPKEIGPIKFVPYQALRPLATSGNNVFSTDGSTDVALFFAPMYERSQLISNGIGSPTALAVSP